jgi:8-oxo-dGTP pyrophosphatase MutT (NUDIX family)
VWIGVRGKAGKPGVPACVLLFRVIPKRGGGWHPVTGGVDADESFLEGAKRELQEETGFDPGGGKWIDLELSCTFEGRFGRAEEHAFGFILEHPLEPELDPSEHSAFEWVDTDTALTRVGFEFQQDALRRFLCYLS